jgi:glutaredoxin
MIEVYGKPDCGYCAKAKELLEERKVPFKYYTVGEDIDARSLVERFPGIRTVPVVVSNGSLVGGFDDLKSYIEDTTNGHGDDF